MAAAENLKASRLLEQRRLHLGREIATAAGWRTIRSITAQDVPGGAVIVDVHDDEPLIVWPHKRVSVRNRTPLDTGNCFGVYSRGLIVETHPDRASADASVRDPGDFLFISARVVLVCPVHPQHVADGFCPDCTDADLPAVLAAEDAAQDGGLRAEQRRTCPACQTWATPEHLNGLAHYIATRRAAIRPTRLPKVA